MSTHNRIKIGLKSALVAMVVLAFNLFFLVSTLSDGYQELSVTRFSTQLSEIGDRLDNVLNDSRRYTLGEIREVLIEEKTRLLLYSNGLAEPSASLDPEQRESMVDLAIALTSGDVVVSSRQGNRRFELPDRLRQIAIDSAERGELQPIEPIRKNGSYYLAHPLYNLEDRPVGMVVVSIDPRLLQAWVGELLGTHHEVMAQICLLAVALVLLVVILVQNGATDRQQSVYKSVLLLLSLVQAVLLYSAVTGYHANQVSEVREQARIATIVLDKILSNRPQVESTGMDPATRRKLDKYVGSTLDHFQAVTLSDDTGRVLFTRISDQPPLPRTYRAIARSVIGTVSSKESWVSSQVHVGSGESGRMAMTVVQISEDSVLRKTVSLVSNGLTMLVVSLLLTVEILLLLVAIGGRPSASVEPGGARPELVRYMRPAMFFFLFGIDLSMAFVPLHMHELYTPLLGLPKDMVLGLPISVEFGFVGLFFLLTGFWVDRRGWHEPFVIGLCLAAMGVAYSWVAPDAMQFVLSRALVGSGYGMALMASQGFVVTVGGSRHKASGLANMFAGLYAGSICGAVAGSVMAEQFGYRFVFLTGAVVIAIVIPYTFALMRQAMQRPAPQLTEQGTPVRHTGADVLRFLSNPTVLSLILLSSLPASIAVAGFIHFFTPTYLDQLGLRESTIGQILMIYGVCQIFIGPKLGHYMDRSRSKKTFITIGNLLGSLAFLTFILDLGIIGVGLAVLLLGLSSSFVLASQSTMLLGLSVSERLGQGVAIGIFRSSSRIGQVIGPMLFGAVLLATDINMAVTLIGIAYFAALLLFIVFAREEGEEIVTDKQRLDARAS